MTFSKRDFGANLLNNSDVSKTMLNIYDGTFVQENLTAERCYYLRKKAPSQMFEMVLKTPLNIAAETQ